MNWTSFAALFARDLHVARRNAIATLLQTMLQPLMFTFVFGQVMIRSGMMQESYKGILLPGIIALCMTLTGVQAVAMPLLAEFQFTREIEDRLLAPIRIEWLAVEKILAGMIQALIAGSFVALPARFLLGPNLGLHFDHPLLLLTMALLVALFSAAGGLALGCTVSQTQIGLMFSVVIAPMMMFGCAYYPWSALASFPIVQKLVLLNPLVYASEGLRGALVPQYPHLSMPVVIGVLGAVDIALVLTGLYRFQRKAVG